MTNKIKRIIGFSLLFIMLIIIKLFFGGTYLDDFWEELIPEILLVLIISFILMIVPLIFRLISKNRINYKKGRIICVSNSLVLFILFSIPNLISILKGNDNTRVMTIDPITFSKQLILIYFVSAIIYYVINMCFFVDNKK